MIELMIWLVILSLLLIKTEAQSCPFTIGPYYVDEALWNDPTATPCMGTVTVSGSQLVFDNLPTATFSDTFVIPSDLAQVCNVYWQSATPTTTFTVSLPGANPTVSFSNFFWDVNRSDVYRAAVFAGPYIGNSPMIAYFAETVSQVSQGNTATVTNSMARICMLPSIQVEGATTVINPPPVTTVQTVTAFVAGTSTVIVTENITNTVTGPAETISFTSFTVVLTVTDIDTTSVTDTTTQTIIQADTRTKETTLTVPVVSTIVTSDTLEDGTLTVYTTSVLNSGQTRTETQESTETFCSNRYPLPPVFDPHH